jgi:hypothetical protein
MNSTIAVCGGDKRDADYWRSRVSKRRWIKDNKEVESTNYYVRIQRNGERREYHLKTPNIDEAAERAANLWQELLASVPKWKNNETKPLWFVEPSHTNVLRLADFSAQCAGVYFLMFQSRVVYVGATHCVAKRIGDHCRNKRFDRAYFIPAELQHAFAIERTYIHKLQPVYNRAGTSRRATDRRNGLKEAA